MAKVGLMMSVDKADGRMSAHFGKAQWIMIADSENKVPRFVKNEVLNGRGTVDIVVQHGCTDVVLVDIGDGALGHLRAANICVWVAPGPVSGNEALRMFTEGQLAPLSAVSVATERGGHHGRCCTGGAS